MSFRDCMIEAVKGGALTPREAEDLLRRYEEKAKANEAEIGPATARAKALADLGAELSAEATQKQRINRLTVAATDTIKTDLAQYRTAFGKKNIVASVYDLIENYGHAGYGSVKGKMQALIAASHAEMEQFLYAFRRNFALGTRMNKPVLADVVRAAFGADVSPEAQALYRAWLKPAEKLRQLFNQAGGSIGWRDGWGLPQGHDAAAINGAGFARWRDYVSQRLDWDKMQHAGTNAPILLAERNGVLKYVWDSIVQDGWNSREPSSVNYRPSLANSRNDARFLVFKDAESWIDYNTNFGKGDIFATMMDHVHGLAKDVAMMERLGPNPRATMEWLKQVIEQEGAKFKAGEMSMWGDPAGKEGKLTAQRLAVDRGVYRARNVLDGYYEQMKGTGAPENTLALAGTVLRNWQMGAKLGSAVIVHATTNPFIQSYARYLAGVPLARLIPDMLNSMKGASVRELTRAGVMMDDALHGIGTGAREASSMARAAELSKWLPDRTSTLTGLAPLVANQKRSFAWGMMGHVADQIEKSWGELPARLRNTMAGYGISPVDWKIMQMADLHEPIADAPFLRWKEIRDVGTGDRADEVAALIGHDGSDPVGTAVATARTTEQAAMKYLEMIQQETERATPSSTWRTRAFMLGRTDPGSIGGFMLRSATMFHGFIASFMMTQMTALTRELGASVPRGAGYGAAVLATMSLGGMLALQLKTIRSGKDALPVDPTTKQGFETWVHAILTGGGFGIFGDFLAADRTSYGHGPIETMFGPIAGMAADMYEAAKQMGSKAVEGKDPQLGKAITNTVRYNTPFFSTAWPLQAAFNRVAMDQLQFLMDPKAHKRMHDQQARVYKETGQGFWWRPGEIMPERAPGFTPGQ